MPNNDKNKQGSNNGIDEKYVSSSLRDGNTAAMENYTKTLYLANTSFNNTILKMIKRKKNIRSSYVNLDQEGLSFRMDIANFKMSGRSLTFILGKFLERNLYRTVLSLTTAAVDGDFIRIANPFQYDSMAFVIQSLSANSLYCVSMLGVDFYRNNTEQLDSMIGILDIQLAPSDNDNMYFFSRLNINSEEDDVSIAIPNGWHRPKKIQNIKIFPSKEEMCLLPVLKGEIIKTLYVDQPNTVDDKTLYAIIDEGIATMLKQGLLPFENTGPRRVDFPHFPQMFSLPKTRPLCIPPLHQLVIAPGVQNLPNESNSSNVFNNSNLYDRQRTFLTWPYGQIISSEDLAKAGFFWTQDKKRIVCIGCNCEIEIQELTTNGFDTFRRHRQISPSCSYLNNASANSAEQFNLDQSHSLASLNIESDNSVSSLSSLDHEDILKNTNQTNFNSCVRRSVTPDSGATAASQNARKEDVVKEEQISPNNQTQPVAQAGAYACTMRNVQHSDPNNRRQTFRYWDPEIYRDIDKLVDAGFFFTGDEDVVRCFHCDIGLAEWNQTDDPWVEHARHSPKCPYLRDNKSEQFIDEVQSSWSRIYTPKHPEYNERSSRLKSFENAMWPRAYVLQTPAQLADAGFFYTGDRDTVRCHYCDGGMREWEPGDDPWIEHARWFPFCKFVLKMKGIQFIQQCSTGEGSRPAESAPSVPAKLPAAYTQKGESLSCVEEWKKKEKMNPILTAAAQGVKELGESLSCVEEWKKKEQMNPLLTAAAQGVKELGYSKATLEAAINKYISKEGKRNFGAEDLMYIIIDMEDKGLILPEENDQASSSGSNEWQVDENEDFIFTPDAIQKENEVMKKRFLCIVCTTKDRTMVFVPCGHRLMCEMCASQQKKCVHCDTSINNMVKSYLC